MAHAQNTEVVKPKGLQVSPIRIDWEMCSGERRVGKFNVKNYTSGSRNVTVSVENFFVSSDSEHVNLFGGEDGHPRHMFNVIDWFSVPNDFVLEAGEAKDIEFAITVPEGQPTNGYYGTILFQTTNKVDGGDEDFSAAKVGVNYRVGSIVTLAVRGDEDPKISGALRRFDSLRRWYIDAPIALQMEMINDGNMHYKMDGEIVVTRFGKKFTTIKIDPEVMYPDSTRTFTKNVSFDIWDFGVYNAKLTMHSAYDDVVFESEIKNIYVLPRNGLIYGGSGIVIIVFCIWFLRNFVTIGIKKKKTQDD
ncbi:MAG: hypothetical protein WC819_06750 [Parcubacteria group bacterium]